MNKPIRVLHIVTHMNRGGIETMIMNYYRNIDRDRIQFDFLTHRSEKKDYDDEIIKLGGRIYHLPPLNPFSLNYRKELKKFFLENKNYQIVHCHLDCMSAVPLRYAKKVGIKNRIAHSHSSSQDRNLKYIIKYIYKKRIKKYATYFFSCGQLAGKWMFGKQDFHILNNAINLDKFRYNRDKALDMKKKLDLIEDLVIGNVGRFNYPKNHKFLIDIFYQISQKYSKTKLILVGKGELEDEIKDKVEELGLKNKVKFLGLREDVSDLLQAIDVFLFPSIYEGFPVTLIEAQASGLPCIISNTISEEVKLTKNVIALDLKDDIKNWCDKIVEFRDFERDDNIIYKADLKKYDIIKNTSDLFNIYMRMIDNV